MSTSANYSCSNSKDYFQIFNKNLVIGYQVATAAVASDIVKAPALHDNPFANRVINLGTYNALQDVSFQRTNSDWKNETDNFFYLGTLQTLKFVPNVFIQSMMKGLLYKGDKVSKFTKFTDTFITVTAGMTVFFGVGAIENKIISETIKVQFVATLAIPLSIRFFLFAPFDTKLDVKTKAVQLSINDLFFTNLGLIGSYVVPDIMHRIGIDKGGKFEVSNKFLFEASITTVVAIASNFNPLLIASSLLFNGAAIDQLLENTKIEEIKIFDYSLLNIASLTIMTIPSVINDATTSIARIAGFTLAKAIAATSVEIIYAYKDDICDYFLLEPLCKYIGIIDHTTQETL